MYKIIGVDGKEYGPINLDQLRQWITEGRVNTQTRVLPEGGTDWKTVAEIPELAGSLPPTPAPTPFPAAMPGAAISPDALNMVNGPSIGLIITGSLNILTSVLAGVMALVGFGATAFHTTPANERLIARLSGPLGIIKAAIGLVGGAFILFGAIKMKKLESYGLAMAASIVAMLPFVFSS